MHCTEILLKGGNLLVFGLFLASSLRLRLGDTSCCELSGGHDGDRRVLRLVLCASVHEWVRIDECDEGVGERAINRGCVGDIGRVVVIYMRFKAPESHGDWMRVIYQGVG